MRFFNTAGRCIQGEHYMLPPAPRLPDARLWIERKQYFIVHAPRQTGKTTTLAALAEELTREGRYVALRFSVERAETARDDVAGAEQRVLAAMRGAAVGQGFPAEWLPPDPRPQSSTGSRVFDGLQDWALRCPLPLVLFFDEIDSLSGDSLNAVLRQIRDGYDYRPHAFPLSVALCGMRQLRDYKLAAGGSGTVSPGRASPFNIAVESARIGDFTAEDVAALYAQHTADTGQEFTLGAVERAFEYTQGQPWLVNALAREITDKMRVAPPAPITAAHVDMAKERLILAGATHLDSLATRLREPRIRAIMEPLITGADLEADDDEADDEAEAAFDQDLAYVRDLGLIAPQNPVRVTNPIYREVIVRELGSRTTARVTDNPSRFILPDGRLDFRELLVAFTEFWVENGEFLVRKNTYHEAAAQIVFMAFLQRIVNGGGYINREYGVGRGRIDILVRKLCGDGREQREAVELKVWNPGKPDPLPLGLRQLDGYLERLGLDAGTLIIFDRRHDALPIDKRIAFGQEHSPSGRPVTLLRA